MSLPLSAKVAGVTPLKRGNDFYWEVIRNITEENRGDLISTRAIASFADKKRGAVINAYLKLLCEAGYLERVDCVCETKLDRFYKVVRRPVETPVLAAKHGHCQQAIWDAITWPLRQGFTIKDLIIAASTAELPVQLKLAQRYVQYLANAGLLTVVKTARHQEKTYRIKPSAMTGPKAPRIARLDKAVVFDANTRTIVGHAIELDEAVL